MAMNSGADGIVRIKEGQGPFVGLFCRQCPENVRVFGILFRKVSLRPDNSLPGCFLPEA